MEKIRFEDFILFTQVEVQKAQQNSTNVML